MEFYDLMAKAAEDVGLEFTYMRLLQEWNEKINLTAILEDEEIIKKHFIDSIKAFKRDEFKKNVNMIDVGTGAGFPGIPIAIMNPNINVTLLDSLNKRIKFLDIVISKLGLKNIKTIHSRAEDGGKNRDLREKFDIATSRAVANMTVLSEFCLPFVKVGGSFVALKGPLVDEELNQSRNAIGTLGGKLQDVIKVDIEDTELKHNIVVVNKVKECPMSFPRKAGMVTKKPLK